MKIRLDIKQRKYLYIYLLLYFGYFKTMFYNISGILTIIQYMFLGVILIYILNVSSKGLEIRKLNSISVTLILFIISFYISSYDSPSKIYNSIKIKEMTITLIFCALIYIIGREIDIIKMLNTISTINVVVLLLYGLINFKEIFLGTVINRIGSADGDNPIWVCRICCETVLAMIIVDVLEKRKLYFIRFMQYVYVSFIIFRTGSKGPGVAFIIVLFVFMNLANILDKKMRRKMVKFLCLFAVIISPIIMLNYSTISAYLHKRIADVFVNVRGYRWHMYTYTIDMIKKSPVLGYGLGSWGLYYFNLDIARYPHNIILETWFEIGIIGVVLFLAMVFFIIEKSKRNVNFGYQIIMLFFLFSFICSMFSGSISGGNRGVYVFAVLLAVNCQGILTNRRKEEKI